MENNWSTLSPEEKRCVRYQRWFTQNIAKCPTPEAQESFRTKEKRINDAIVLKIPDRVPINLQDMGYFPAKYNGVTFRQMVYDSEVLVSTFKKTIIDLDPDTFWNPTIAIPGKALEILDCKQLRWPGGSLPDNCSHQYKEDEYMRADEYDSFIKDPTDFALRAYLPQTLGACQPFKKLPNLNKLFKGYPGLGIISGMVSPEIISAFEKLYQAGLIIKKHFSTIEKFQNEMTSLGFPSCCGPGSVAPFDLISDSLRGMRGVMLDMYKQPDKLLEAIEKITPLLVDSLIADANVNGHPRVRLTIHRGSDAFMSDKQWETFYWPGYKRLIDACIEEGITPMLFCEGNIASRLKYLAELPRGKVVAILDSTDLYKAKEILGGKMCICGLMPVSVLQTGTPDEVREHAKRLIDVVGKDGGFIMAPRSVLDETNPELVKVWLNFTKEYGVYK
jgi:hypothetical protein